MKPVTLRGIGLATATVILVGLVALTATRVHGSMTLDEAVARFETSVGPLDFDAYRPPAVPDRDNAALPILEALERLEARRGAESSGEEVGRLKLRNRVAAADWTPEDVSRAREVLASHPRVLALLYRAAGRPGSSFGLDYAAGPEMEIPNFVLILQAADLLFAEARLAWLDGRPGAAISAVEALATLSRTLEGEAPLIFQLVGHGVEILQYRAVQDGLAAGGLGPEVLRRLRASAGDRPRLDRLRRSLGAEGSILYSIRRGGPYAEAFARTQSYYGRLQHRWLGDRALAQGLDYYVRIAEAFPEVAYAEMLESPGLLARPPDEHTGLVVALQGSVATLQATETLARLARLALDLGLRAAESGAFPERLPAGSETGADPFAGRVPVYERAVGGSATLSIPGADELWREVRPRRTGNEDEASLFRWRLAAPPG